METYIGIDLGTTNTVAAILNISDKNNINPEIIDIIQFDVDFKGHITDKILPSYIYINEFGTKYIGKAAKYMKDKQYDRVIYNSKNYIGDNNYLWKIDDFEYSPEDIAAMLLKEIKKNIENKIKREVNNAVITVPASFNHDQITATKKAAILAGFKENEIYFISEPTAAILDFINNEKKLPQKDRTLDFSSCKKVLVFDLGGGTCDVSILNILIKDMDFKVEELAISPHTQLGGINFDLRGVVYLINKFLRETGCNIDSIFKNENDKRKIYSIMASEVEKARIFFMSHKGENDNVFYSFIVPDFIDGKSTQFTLTKVEYIESIEPLLKSEGNLGYNIIDPIKDTLSKANMTNKDIDNIFLVGGMTLYKPIYYTLEKYFGKAPITNIDPMFAVARGAAIYDYYNRGINKNNNKNIKIDPVVADNIYIDVENDLPFLIVKQGTRAPFEITYNNVLKVSNATGMKIDIFSGRSIWDPKMKRLKSGQVSFLNLVKPGTPISLNVKFDKNRILSLSAWIENSEEYKLNVTIGEGEDKYEY